MIHQVSPPLPLVTPKGKGFAHFIIDEGVEHHIYWVVFLDDGGECWTFSNPEVRAQRNITLSRDYISPFYNPKDVALVKKGKERTWESGFDPEDFFRDDDNE